MKHESFDEREIYYAGVLDGLTLALEFPDKAREMRESVLYAKASEAWRFMLEELKLVK
ncbi:MAG: hypothetical protein QW393_04685 [Candidatus Micrarchaeaceae archaeon]